MRAAGEETQCYRIVGRGWGVETSLRRYLAKALRHRGNHSTIWGGSFPSRGSSKRKGTVAGPRLVFLRTTEGPVWLKPRG